MPGTIRKLIFKAFGVIVNSNRGHRSWNRPIHETARRHDERCAARMPKNIHQAPFKLHCRPENRVQSAPGPSPRCSTAQYTFPGNLRPVCPFQSESEKLQTTNKIRHFKHVC